MICRTCGQKFDEKAGACPFCGDTGAAGFSAGATFESDAPASFSDEFDAVPPASSARKPAGRRRGKGSRIAVLAVVVLAIGLAAAAILLLPKESGNQKGTPGCAAPTEVFLTVDHGVQVLTNELLISLRPELGQRDLEKILEAQEGAIVGYLPVLHQYQVRFNTDDLNALDEKKSKLEQDDGVLRIDYNFVLPFRAGRQAANFSDLQSQAGNTLGWLGEIPESVAPENRDRMNYLPSCSLTTLDDLTTYCENHKGQVFLLNESETRALENGHSVLYANDRYYETTSDGEITGYTTTAMIRYQIAALIEKDADVICFPAQDFLRTNDHFLREEAELMSTLLETLEVNHPLYVICMGYQQNGFLQQILAGTEAGRRHVLPVMPCEESLLSVFDTTDSGKTLYQALSAVEEGIVCGAAADVETAVYLAALWVEQGKGNALDAAGLLSSLKAHAPALAADADGAVVPALNTAFAPAAQEDTTVYHATVLRIQDAVSGQALADAGLTVGSREEMIDPAGVQLLTNVEKLSVSVAAPGYQTAEQEIQCNGVPEVGIALHREAESTGTMKGRVNAPGGTLLACLEDCESGDVYPDRQIDANFSIPMYPGTYNLTVTGHDRTTVTVYGVTVEAGGVTELQEISLTVPSDLPGTVRGQVIDSMNGNAVAGAELKFFEGVNAADSGTPVLTISSDTAGNYSADLPGGAYTVYASREQYRTSWRTVYSEGETTTADQNCTLTPAVPDGQVRIALTWGRNPSDLDSHLVNKSAGIHVFYSVKEAKKNGRTVVELDHDDTSSYGPEQTTIMVQEPGEYVFYVHDYTNAGRTSSTALAQSDATVTVYVGENEPMIFHVPNQAGTLWKVFTYSNGIVTPSSEMSYQASPIRVGQ